eukprot:9462403-Ditylum_brightwellii.AAC.1
MSCVTDPSTSKDRSMGESIGFSKQIRSIVNFLALQCLLWLRNLSTYTTAMRQHLIFNSRWRMKQVMLATAAVLSKITSCTNQNMFGVCWVIFGLKMLMLPTGLMP